ncbi:hypothetical protein RND81_07G096100 [Saponaria officinalis]|uniref:Xyloglucan endotransglucosylase/hydrolase n=1 Tax=Saponaria officinalis TaxID=3572 RepID=A0AAW1JLK8_SAPOF
MGNIRVMLLAIFASAAVFQICSVHASFSDSTYFYWGADIAKVTGPESVELKVIESGGSGLKSYNSYMYGSISMQIKLIKGNSAGIVTTFYLSSEGAEHDEIDFEFLGNSTDLPYTIHTNVFTKGVGQREQQFKATWYDPTDGFHNYTIFWTPYEIVWLVDSVPIRVFRNHHDTEINYPDSQPMQAYASLWNADDWATQGGLVKTDWSLAPFTACFQGYNPNACVASDHYSVASCSSYNSANWWTDASKYYQLSETDYYQMQWIRSNFMIYDYCTAAKEKGLTPCKECHLPQN